MAVRLSGQLADGLFQAAMFAAVFFNPERATSAGEAAAAFATLLLPYSVVGPFAGVFLDRWRRQRVLVNANLVRAAVITVFALLLDLQGPTSPAVVGLALVVVSANRFILSGLSAALPHVVAPVRLVTANSVSTTLGAGAAAVGGSLAIGLRAVLGKGDTGAARIALVAAAVYVCALMLGNAQLPHRGALPLKMKRDNPLISKAAGYGEDTAHFFVKDADHPYVQEKPFDWIRGYQVGGKSLIWGRACQRWSKFEFTAPERQGYGINWPIGYDDVAPWYSHVEKFIGVCGNADHLEAMPDGEFLPPFDFNCVAVG